MLMVVHPLEIMIPGCPVLHALDVRSERVGYDEQSLYTEKQDCCDVACNGETSLLRPGESRK